MNINYQSDFKIVEVTKGLDPTIPFKFTYRTWKNKEYIASFDGQQTYVNCKRLPNGDLIIAFDNHRLKPGRLMVKREYMIPDTDFTDTVCNSISEDDTGIVLTEGKSDSVNVIVHVIPNYKKGDKGDKLTFQDLTPQDIKELQKPATDAAVLANDAATAANKAAQDANTSKQQADAATTLANEQANRARTEADRMVAFTTSINVSNAYPTGSPTQSNIYTLQSAIAVVEERYRTVGLKCSFLTSASEGEEWQYVGGVYNDIKNWVRTDAKSLDNRRNEIDAARQEAIAAIGTKEQSAIGNFSAQRVTPEMLSEGTKQFINASGGGTITNLPDDEDLTSVGGVLKLADKAYNAANHSGKGRAILRKNIVNGKNILTNTMIQQENTVYHIQYDYDLQGNTLQIPLNCKLQFDGGSLKNGFIKGQQTDIEAGKYCVFNNVSLSGSWAVEQGYPEWFGAKATKGIDDSQAIQNCIDSFRKIYLSTRYYVSNELSIRNTAYLLGRTAINNGSTGIIANDDFNSSHGCMLYGDSNIPYFRLEDIVLDGRFRVKYGFLSADKTYIAADIDRCFVYNFYVAGLCIYGSEFTSIRKCFFQHNHCAIYLSSRKINEPNLLNLSANEGIIVGCNNHSVIRDCHFVFNVYGAICRCDADISITGNLFGHTSLHPVIVNYTTQCHIVDNYYEGDFDADFVIKKVTGVDKVSDSVHPDIISNKMDVITAFGEEIRERGVITAISSRIYVQSIFHSYEHLRTTTKSIEVINRDSHNIQGVDFTCVSYRCGLTIGNVSYFDNSVNHDIGIRSTAYSYLDHGITSLSNNTIIRTYAVQVLMTTPISAPIRYNKQIDINQLELYSDTGVYKEKFFDHVVFAETINRVNYFKYISDNPIYDKFKISCNKLKDNTTYAVIQRFKIIEKNAIVGIVGYGNAQSKNVTEINTYGESSKEPGDLITIFAYFDSNYIKTNYTSLEIAPFSGWSNPRNKILWAMPIVVELGSVDISDNSIQYLDNGAFAEKPNNPPIGAKYFCADRQTTEGAASGIMIYHKGNNVWVDALGREVK